MARKKNNAKLSTAAHIKRHTEGTSNEISFSVLDAAKNALDGEKNSAPKSHPFWLGAVSLFTLPGRKKTISTPEKPKGLHLSSGEFVSAESTSGKEPFALLPSASDGSGTAGTSAGAVGAAGENATAGAGLSAGLPINTSTAKSAAAASSSAKPKWETPVDEVARRKTRRRRAKIIVGSATALVCAAVFVAAGMWIYKQYTVQQDLEACLLASLETVEQADETLQTVDEFTVSLINGDVGELSAANVNDRADQLLALLPMLSETLDAAEADARRALGGLPESVDKEAAYQAISCIEARRDMLNEAEAAMKATLSSAAAADKMREGWNVLLQADTPARDAAALLSDMTQENVEASLSKTKEAMALLADAQALFAAAQETDPAVQIADYLEYISLRQSALECAVASNNAFLNRQKDEMLQQNEAYNSYDSQAAQLAAALPPAPIVRATESLNAATGGLDGPYMSARSRAAAADSFLRDYLGAKGK